jgi:ribosome-associated toxin RatA of RatAB toxin-antitoxin module
MGSARYAILVLSVLTLAEPMLLPEALRAPESVGHDVDAPALRRRYSASEWKAMQGGEVITAEAGDAAKEERTVRAATIVPYPPEQVWLVLGDFEKRPEFLPGAKEIRVARVDGNRVWLDERLKFFLVTIRYRVINTLEPAQGLMSWVLDKSVAHDIADTEGAWQLAAIDAGKQTLVLYRAWIDTGQPVPGFLESYLMKRSLPELIGGLRAEVKRRATAR